MQKFNKETSGIAAFLPAARGVAMQGTATDTAVRITISHEITAHAEKLVAYAERLANLTHEKLAPVMRSEIPLAAQAAKKQMEQQSYPPLFNDLRGKFTAIENSLSVIEDALARTEL